MPKNKGFWKKRTNRYLHVDFYGFSLFEPEIQFLLGRLFFFFYLFAVLEPLEMILEGNVEIETVRSVEKADSDEGRSAVIVLDPEDEITRRIRHGLYRNARVSLDRTLGK